MLSIRLSSYYTREIALKWHFSAQAPHLMHFVGIDNERLADFAADRLVRADLRAGAAAAAQSRIDAILQQVAGNDAPGSAFR